MGLFPSLSLSGYCCHVVIVILVLGTLFSSWRALAGAGYLLKGVRWSVVGIGRWVLTSTWHPSFSFLLIAIGCCSRCCGHRTCPRARGGGGVVVGSGWFSNVCWIRTAWISSHDARPAPNLALRARIQLCLFVSINLSALHVITPRPLSLIYRIFNVSYIGCTIGHTLYMKVDKGGSVMWQRATSVTIKSHLP